MEGLMPAQIRNSGTWHSNLMNVQMCIEPLTFVISKDIPKFVSVVAIALGCIDLIHGFTHSVLLNYAAIDIAGLDLSTPLAGDL